MGASEQIASLLRAAAADLRSDLDRMERIDCLRAERDECSFAAQEHELLMAEGVKDGVLHQVIAKQLRERARMLQSRIDLLLAEFALPRKQQYQYWSRSAVARQSCADTGTDCGDCLDAPENIPAGSCMYGDDDCETLIAREHF